MNPEITKIAEFGNRSIKQTEQESMIVRDKASSSWVVEMKKMLGDFDPAVEMVRRSKQSIYRVPEWIKGLSNSKAYEPRVMSLGPFHHGNSKLQPMEEHKHRAVLHLVKRSRRPLFEFAAAVSDVAEELEAAYGLELDDARRMDRAQFVKLMVTDGCFFLELMRIFRLEGKVEEEYGPDDPVFSEHGYMYLEFDIRSDVLVMENQLPLLLLQKLLRVVDHDDNCQAREVQMMKDLADFLRVTPMAGMDLQGLHPLDVYHKSISCARGDRNGSSTENHKSISCAAELNKAGVHFKASGDHIGGSAGAISFQHGVLSIPEIFVDDSTECIFLNMMAFERLHPGAGNDMMAFVIFVDYLIDTAKDVSLLRSSGIINSGMGSDELVANLFNNILTKGAVMSQSSSLHDVLGAVSAHCSKPWNRWRAIFIHTYFSNPWVFISLIAAVILLVATLMQTVYTIVPFYKNK